MGFYTALLIALGVVSSVHARCSVADCQYLDPTGAVRNDGQRMCELVDMENNLVQNVCTSPSLEMMFLENGGACGCCDLDAPIVLASGSVNTQEMGGGGECPKASSDMSLPERKLTPSTAVALHPRFLAAEQVPDSVPNSLVVAVASGRSAAPGFMFSVKALTHPITITSFKLYFYRSGISGDVQVYTRCGDYASHERTENAWDKIYDESLILNGKNTLVAVNLGDQEKPITIYPDQTQSFFVWPKDSNIMYNSAGASIGRTDAFLQVYEGAGITKKFPDSNLPQSYIFNPRSYQGVIGYVINNFLKELKSYTNTLLNSFSSSLLKGTTLKVTLWKPMGQVGSVQPMGSCLM